MFARASCEDGDRSVYFASVRFESASTPLYHEFPFLLPVTGHRFPSVTDSSTNLVFQDDATQTWYNFAYVIWDNIPSSMMTIVERIVETANHLQRDHLQRDPSISRRIEERNLTIVQRGQPIRIPRRNCRDYSMFPSNSRSKSSIDPRKIHRFPPRILDVNKSDVEPNLDLPFARRMLEEAEELLTVRRFYRIGNEQTNETVVDRWSDRFDSIRTGYTITTRHTGMPSPIAISMLALCLLI